MRRSHITLGVNAWRQMHLPLERIRAEPSAHGTDRHANLLRPNHRLETLEQASVTGSQFFTKLELSRALLRASCLDPLMDAFECVLCSRVAGGPVLADVLHETRFLQQEPCGKFGRGELGTFDVVQRFGTVAKACPTLRNA